MKKINYHYKKAVVVLLTLFLNGTISLAQDIAGQWNGILNVQGISLRIVFHINKTGDSHSATMDSPDQNATGIPVTSTTFDGSKLSLAIPTIGLLYEGAFEIDSIVGTFKQSGLSIPLTLKRTTADAPPVVRPQEPKPPFPYHSEEVTFENKEAGVTLAGTLTLPEKGSNFTAVILISGSGAQDRNEEIFGHKPFLVIADYLTQRGFAVLRYDDRGTAQSTGDFRTATTADFATDAESAVAYLKTRKEINLNKIGLMGHSEGGMIAPIVAARSEDMAFIVMLAGTGIRSDVLLLLQTELIARASGISEDQITKSRKLNARIYDKIVNSKESVSLQEMTNWLIATRTEFGEFAPEEMFTEDNIRNIATSTTSPWMQYFLRYDPAPVLEKVKCPVLAINGSKDLQVPPKENLEAIRASLEKGGNKNVTIKEYSGLNHLFQECTTGAPAEYGTIEQTFSPEVLKDLSEWLSNI